MRMPARPSQQARRARRAVPGRVACLVIAGGIMAGWVVTAQPAQASAAGQVAAGGTAGPGGPAGSTPRGPGDLLVIGRAAMGYAVFRSVVAQRSYRLPAGSGHHAYDWENTNLLLGSYAGAIGIKTGNTDAAGYCLLFEARRGARTLIGVVLDSSATVRAASFGDATQMLNWGFR